VATLLDYELQKGTNLITGETWKISLPKSNVLQFITEDGSKISARPSGTEPKIKFYFSVNTQLDNAAEFDKKYALLQNKINGIIADMNLN
jgi:phosphoglucomutase